MNIADTPVFPKEMLALLGNIHPSTLRDQIKAGKIPDYDVKLTQKTRYWYRSTLERAGLLKARQEEASQPTPASSDAALA